MLSDTSVGFASSDPSASARKKVPLFALNVFQTIQTNVLKVLTEAK